MQRAHRVALKPTRDQESLFSQHAGYARFAYNWAVGEFKAGLDVGEWLHDRSLRPRWNRVKPLIVAVGCGAVLKRRQVCHHRLRAGSGRLGSASQAREGWPAVRSSRRIPEVQAAEARAGLPGGQWTGHRESGRQGGHTA